MFKNIFKNIYAVISTKYFRFALGFTVLALLFIYHFNGHFNRDKFFDAIEAVRDNSKQKKVEERNKNNVIVVKKQIKIDDENVVDEKSSEENIEKTEEEKEKDEKAKKETEILNEKITNVFLKLRRVEEAYKYKLENKKINHKRIIKEGDFVYYSMRSIFNEDFENKHIMPNMNVFIKVKKGDFLGDKLIGKKIGEAIQFSYNDMVDEVNPENSDVMKNKIKDTLNTVNNIYNKDKKVITSTKIYYEITPLDFVSNSLVKELGLEAESAK